MEFSSTFTLDLKPGRTQVPKQLRMNFFRMDFFGALSIYSILLHVKLLIATTECSSTNGSLSNCRSLRPEFPYQNQAIEWFFNMVRGNFAFVPRMAMQGDTSIPLREEPGSTLLGRLQRGIKLCKERRHDRRAWRTIEHLSQPCFIWASVYAKRVTIRKGQVEREPCF